MAVLLFLVKRLNISEKYFTYSRFNPPGLSKRTFPKILELNRTNLVIITIASMATLVSILALFSLLAFESVSGAGSGGGLGGRDDDDDFTVAVGDVSVIFST